MTLAEMFRAEMVYRQAAYCLIKHSQIIYKLLQMTLKQDLVVKLYIQHCVAMDHQLKRKLDDFTRFAFNCWVETPNSKKILLYYFFSFFLSCFAASLLKFSRLYPSTSTYFLSFVLLFDEIFHPSSSVEQLNTALQS